MNAKLELEDLYFPVKTSKVFTLLDGTDKHVQIHGKKALINGKTNRPISVVSSGYEIITNKEAFLYGENCIRTLFELKGSDKVNIYKVSASDSLTFCNIDLFSKNQNLFVLIKDQYIPFVRVTNSYNTMFSLSFKVGIYRVKCSNGMISEDESIIINYSHVRGAKRRINFQVNKESFQEILNKFKTDIQILVDSAIPELYHFPIFCKALNLHFNLEEIDEKKKIREAEKLEQTKIFYEDKFNVYKKELGNDNYALYNVITNAASFGLNNEKSYKTKINKRQSRAGVWLRSFSELLKDGNIDYEEYLKGYLDLFKN